MQVPVSFEIPTILLVAAAVGACGLIVGLMLRTPTIHPHPHYQSHYDGGANMGCLGVIVLIVVVILGILLLPTLLSTGEAPSDGVLMLQANTKPEGSADIVAAGRKEREQPLFPEVDDLASWDHAQDTVTSVTEAPYPELVQLTVSARQDWAESAARKYEKQGAKFVEIRFSPDSRYPYRIFGLMPDQEAQP